MEKERDGTKRGRWRGGERGQDGEREMGRGEISIKRRTM